jgi:hypothetical protein
MAGYGVAIKNSFLNLVPPRGTGWRFKSPPHPIHTRWWQAPRHFELQNRRQLKTIYMKRTIKRVFAVTTLTILVTISGLATILLFPQPLFANKMEHKQFTVYSNDKITADIVPLLDNAMALVEKSEINDPNYQYDILLSFNSLFNKIDDKLLGFGPSARATDNNVTIKVRVDTKRDLFFPTFHRKCQSSLTYLLAHEMIHCLQAHKYGITKFNPLKHPEMWKLEGYPEYVARQPKLTNKNYNLTSEIDRYIELESKSADLWVLIEEGACEAPNYYYKGRLMVEYLMDIKHWSYDKILNDTTSTNSVYEDMINWRNELKKKKN